MIHNCCSSLCNPWTAVRLVSPSQSPWVCFVHCVNDAIQPSHPLLSPSPAFNLSQHQGLFPWVSSSHSVAKVLELQFQHQSVSSVTQSCPALCDPMGYSTPGIPVPHQLPEFTQTHVHRVGDAIQPSHPPSSPSPPAFNLSQKKSQPSISTLHIRNFQWVSSLHQVAKVMELQIQH